MLMVIKIVKSKSAPPIAIPEIAPNEIVLDAIGDCVLSPLVLILDLSCSGMADTRNSSIRLPSRRV